MNVLIYANCSIGGGIQVCDSIIRTLSFFPQYKFVVCASCKVIESLGNDFATVSNIKLLQSPHQSNLLRLCGRNPAMDDIVSNHKINVVFTVFGPSYWKPKVPHLCGFAIPHYVYPESEYLKNISLKEKIRLALLKKIGMRAFLTQTDAVVSENPAVSDCLTRMYGFKHVYTVYNTCNFVFSKPELWDRNCKLQDFDGTTLLTIASYYPHKNLEIMVPTAHCLKNKYPDFKFRFVLSINREQLQSDISGLEENFIFLGKVSIAQCPYLYQQAQIMFLPTLLECFSSTWAEAMFMQVPILTSDLPFAHGICDYAAMYIDPCSPEKIAESIYELAFSKELQQSLIRNGNIVRQKFSDSKKRMMKYLDIMEKMQNVPNE